MGEDNSEPIKVHSELNSGSSSRPSVRLLATEIFPKISVASTGMHLMSTIKYIRCCLPSQSPQPARKDCEASHQSHGSVAPPENEI